MSSRRTTPSVAMDFTPPTSPDQPSNISPAVPSDVIAKLLGFTFAMITLPIGTYFASVNTIFSGNSTYAGAAAAIMANVVLVGFIVVAIREDRSEQLEKAAGKKQE